VASRPRPGGSRVIELWRGARGYERIVRVRISFPGIPRGEDLRGQRKPRPERERRTSAFASVAGNIL